MESQFKLLQELINKAGINVVTCGMCGDVLLHRVNEDEVSCPHCEFKSDPCDFPDLFLK